MRACNRANDVESIFDVGHPVAHRFIQRIFQRAAATADRHYRRSQQLHAINIGRLARHVFFAHINHAFHRVARRDGRRGHTMLAGTGFRDYAGLAHPLREQRLTDGIVDLVCTGVIQILALQIDLRAAEQFRPAARVINRTRPADVVLQLALKFGDEIRVVLVFQIRRAQFVECVHQRLGYKNSAVGAKVSARVRKVVRLHTR